MPSYQFAGLVETSFPFDRDAKARPVGTVQPGDVREFDEAPGWPWVPAEDAPPPAAAAEPEPAPAPVEQPPAAEQPAEQPAPGPVPAPPAVVPPAGPQPFAVTPGA